MAAANDTYELVNFFESTNTSYEVNAGNAEGTLKGTGPEDGQSPSADRGEDEPK
jgi:ribonucleoside-diphosphate reductase beta chain